MSSSKRIGVAAAMAMLAGAAFGQGDMPLSGPQVKQDRPAGLGGQFAEGKEDRKGPITERVPMRLYVQAIDKLRGDDAPADLRLTEDQSTKIRAIETEFRQSMQAYMQKARQEGGGQGGKKRPLAAPDEKTPEGQPDGARMRELMRNAPNPTDAQVKVYALLSPGQQKFVQAEVAKGQAELEKRRSEEYAQRQLQKKKGEASVVAQDAAPINAPPGGPPEGRERVRRLMERLAQLSPQEREQLLNRIEQELDRRGIAAGDGKGPRRQGVGDPKPAPNMGDVNVPAPEKP